MGCLTALKLFCWMNAKKRFRLATNLTGKFVSLFLVALYSSWWWCFDGFDGLTKFITTTCHYHCATFVLFHPNNTMKLLWLVLILWPVNSDQNKTTKCAFHRIYVYIIFTTKRDFGYAIIITNTFLVGSYF